MQIICTLLKIDNHTSTSPLSMPDALPAAQARPNRNFSLEKVSNE